MQPRFLSFPSLLANPATTWAVGLAAVAAALVPAGPAAAQPSNPAIATFTTCTVATECSDAGYGFDTNFGYLFTPTATTKIEWLGVYDDPTNDGLTKPIDVSIWKYNNGAANNSPIATTKIPQGTASVKLGNFRYRSISPLTLTADQDYVVAAFYPAGITEDIPQFIKPVLHPTTTSFPALTWASWATNGDPTPTENGNSGYLPANMPTFLGTYSGTTYGFIGPNMALDDSQPPLPGTPGPLSLLAAPAAWSWSRRLRRHCLRATM